MPDRALEICIKKAQSDQGRSDDAKILNCTLLTLGKLRYPLIDPALANYAVRALIWIDLS
jgi:hypothetical protein